MTNTFGGLNWFVASEPVNAMGLTAKEIELEQTRLMMEEAVRNMSLTGMALGLEAAKTEKDTAYNERNRLVALLARIFPSGVLPDATTPDYQIVYIDLPTGQASWHIPTTEMGLFAGLPYYKGYWDNHTTTEKWQRVEKLVDILKNFDVTITPRTAEPLVFKSEYPADTKQVFKVDTGGKRSGKVALAVLRPGEQVNFTMPILVRAVAILTAAQVGGPAFTVYYEEVT